MEETRQISTGYLIKRFAPYFKKYRWVLVLDLFCAALTTICELVLPLIVRFITDKGMNDMASLSVKLILYVGLFYLILRLIDAAANYFMANIGHVMGARIETDMRRDLFEHLQKLSFSYYSNTKVGQIMARITSDLFDVTEFAHHCPEEFFIAALKITVSSRTRNPLSSMKKCGSACRNCGQTNAAPPNKRNGRGCSLGYCTVPTAAANCILLRART